MKKHASLILLVVIFALITTGCSGFKTFKLPTSAMSPTLVKGDWLISTPSSEYKRGDIIVFKYPKDQQVWYIFRIAGLPGETVELKNNQLFVNGSLVKESYVSPENNVKKIKEGIYRVPENNYFVLGDNRDNSSDSRYWGTVPKELIYGIFYMKYYHKEE